MKLRCRILGCRYTMLTPGPGYDKHSINHIVYLASCWRCGRVKHV